MVFLLFRRYHQLKVDRRYSRRSSSLKYDVMPILPFASPQVDIPTALASILQTNQRAAASVASSLSVIEIWLADNRLVFFPDYTNHGLGHVKSLLSSMTDIISPRAWSHLTAEDASALVLAIALHDCAMHISEVGFLSLIDGSYSTDGISAYFLRRCNDTSWTVLWLEFLQEACRFDNATQLRLYGTQVRFRRPPSDPLSWTVSDKLLIGEFLRRNHARLAHEIAIHGVPGPQAERLSLQGFDEEMSDLIGFIARSHHLNLRIAVDALPIRRRKMWRNVHVPFVMAALRIADFAQLHASRAPIELLKVRQLWSPQSRKEWHNHYAIKEILVDEVDPEAIWIDAVPEDVSTYLALKQLFKALQAELDTTWATLGEAYGADPELSNLGLRYRRVRSTIDDHTEFSKHVQYIPVDLAFRTASGGILKILVGPLYGYHPQYGVRELLQNATDACRELRDLLETEPGIRFESPSLDADVVISLVEDNSGGWLVVEDKGIGMTIEVVRDYFLTAGASFRYSPEWSRLHRDENGYSRVLRSGRFGVGVLAAFLVGPEIEVSTRNVSQTEGIYFRCTMGDEYIEACRIQRPVGTTIRVRIVDQRVLDTLFERRHSSGGLGSDWDWYALDEPSVVCKLSSKGGADTRQSINAREQRVHIPGSGSELPAMWHRICHSDFDDLQWTLKGPIRIWCNGIMVSNVYSTVAMPGNWNVLWHPSDDGLTEDEAVTILLPNLSVFDGEGRLSLNLHRTELSDVDLPFKAELVNSVSADAIAYLVAWLDEAQESAGCMTECDLRALVISTLTAANTERELQYVGIRGRPTWRWLSFTHVGIVMSEASLIREVAPKHIWFVPISINSDARAIPMPNDGVLEVLMHWPQQKYSERSKVISARWVLTALLGYDALADSPGHGNDVGDFAAYFAPASHLQVAARSVLLSEDAWPLIEEAVARGLSGNLVIQQPVPGYVLLSCSENQDAVGDFSALVAGDSISSVFCMAIWKSSDVAASVQSMSPVTRTWISMLGKRCIPFDYDLRHRELQDVYEASAAEIRSWREYLEKHKLPSRSLSKL